jgi:hypothetical protein
MHWVVVDWGGAVCAGSIQAPAAEPVRVVELMHGVLAVAVDAALSLLLVRLRGAVAVEHVVGPLELVQRRAVLVHGAAAARRRAQLQPRQLVVGAAARRRRLEPVVALIVRGRGARGA